MPAVLPSPAQPRGRAERARSSSRAPVEAGFAGEGTEVPRSGAMNPRREQGPGPSTATPPACVRGTLHACGGATGTGRRAPAVPASWLQRPDRRPQRVPSGPDPGLAREWNVKDPGPERRGPQAAAAPARTPTSRPYVQSERSRPRPLSKTQDARPMAGRPRPRGWRSPPGRAFLRHPDLKAPGCARSPRLGGGGQALRLRNETAPGPVVTRARL